MQKSKEILYQKNIEKEFDRGQVSIIPPASGSVGKDFVYHAYGHEFESRLKWK